MERKGKKIQYMWVIVALCALMIFTCLGFCSSTNSLFINKVTEHLGVDRGIYAINQSLRFIATAVVNLFFGSMIVKFGAKKLVIAGFASLAAGITVYGLAESIYVFYIGGILLGIGFAWTGTTMVGYIVNRWCKNNRGTIMGAILASNGIGGALAMQIVSPIIESGATGYKKAYFLIAIILLAVGLLVAIFLKDKPTAEGEGAAPSKKKKRGQSWTGIEFSDATRRPYFYATLLCVFFTGMSLQGINGVSAAHMKDVGIDPAYVATVLSCHSLALTGFKFLVGFLYDKFGLRVTTTICSLTSVAVMITLALVTASQLGLVLAMIYGVFSALALPLETIMLPIYAGDLFGEKSYGKVLGIIASVNTAGYALGSPVVNLCFDRTGSYNIAFLICAATMVGVTVAMQFVISKAAGIKRTVAAAEAMQGAETFTG